MNEDSNPFAQFNINPTSMIMGLAGMFLGGAVMHAVHLQAKTAQQADQIVGEVLGAPQGSQTGLAQNIVNNLAQAGTVALLAGAQHLMTNAFAPHTSAPKPTPAPAPTPGQVVTRAAQPAPAPAPPAPAPQPPTPDPVPPSDTSDTTDNAPPDGFAMTPGEPA